MSWTYSGDPRTSPKDEVRFLIQDIDVNNQFVSDEGINYAIYFVYGNDPPAIGNFLPAADIADILQVQYAAKADSEAVGDLSISFANTADKFAKIAEKLRRKATLYGVPISVGGLSRQEKIDAYSNSDLLPTAAKVDGMDNVGPDASSQGEFIP